MKTASTEREAIVAWLHSLADDTSLQPAARKAFRSAAHAIENGAHIKDQDHGRA